MKTFCATLGPLIKRPSGLIQSQVLSLKLTAMAVRKVIRPNSGYTSIDLLTPDPFCHFACIWGMDRSIAGPPVLCVLWPLYPDSSSVCVGEILSNLREKSMEHGYTIVRISNLISFCPHDSLKTTSKTSHNPIWKALQIHCACILLSVFITKT